MAAAAIAPARSLSLMVSGSLDQLLADRACSGHLAEVYMAEGAAAPHCAGRMMITECQQQPTATSTISTKLVKTVQASWQYKATGSVRAAALLASLRAVRLPAGGPRSLSSFAGRLLSAGLEDTTYIYDLGNVTRLYQAWVAAMPRVQPFYAVKCNPEPALLKLIHSLGGGFDCASTAELQAARAIGASLDNIIFAHPCKRPCDLKYARETGVQWTTFDTASELHKMAAACPTVKLVLRVRCDDPEAAVKLGTKYGANPDEAPQLLALAKKLALDVVGVSFHVGSGCQNLSAYSDAIATARGVFDAAAEAGHTGMHLLDIGGGFTGHFDASGAVVIDDLAGVINAALAQHFPEESGVRVIAEPGRYFAETSAAILTPVYGKRDRFMEDDSLHKDYWLTDGLYGSFNCLIFDDQKPQPHVLRAQEKQQDGPGKALPRFSSTLWGPTCDSCDFLYKGIPLPELDVGDCLLFPDAGAYTVAGACDFNGIAMTAPNKVFVFSAHAVDAAA